MSAPPVGSVMTQASPVWPRSRVPNAPSPPSSSLTTKWADTRPSSLAPAFRTAARAARTATTPAFASQAPLACTTSPLTRGRNGSLSHRARSPGGTTSTWLWRIRDGPSPGCRVSPTRPHASVRGASPPGKRGCARSSFRFMDQRSTSRSSRSRCRARTCCNSDSAALPVTLGTARSSSRSRAMAASSTAARADASTVLRFAVNETQLPTGDIRTGRRLRLRWTAANRYLLRSTAVFLQRFRAVRLGEPLLKVATDRVTRRGSYRMQTRRALVVLREVFTPRLFTPRALLFSCSAAFGPAAHSRAGEEAQ